MDSVLLGVDGTVELSMSWRYCVRALAVAVPLVVFVRRKETSFCCERRGRGEKMWGV